MENVITHRLSSRGIDPIDLFGQQDIRLRAIESEFDAKIVVRGEEIIVTGEDDVVQQITKVLRELMRSVKHGQTQEISDIIRASRSVKEAGEDAKQPFAGEFLDIMSKRERIRARGPNQQRYLEAVRDTDIVFSIGPAGTGKTYLAVAMALSALRRRDVDRIVLARPAVEAGESLGFLPGDPQEKVDPYLKPLYDALNDMTPNGKGSRLLETGTIEIIPLAYMRGRTLNNAFVILDEAQNTTTAQMKMFLTRLGANSKAIITGDITQVDLPGEKQSGLIEVQNILNSIKGISFIYLTEVDVVRHQLVQEIIKAYERFEDNKEEKN
ncbi:MAG: PhoH family protein [Gemmatimonadota bacterium]|nr:PhoH family protein [Gemmatimonadota bacterium]